MRIEWEDYFMMMAKVAASRSGCNSRPTGAVIVKDKRVISTGYNGTLPGQEQCTDKWSDFCYRRSVKAPEEDKYNVCPSIHAEANAINQAAKYGIQIEGSDIYCTLAPCYVCLKNIASVGIKKVFYELEYESNDKERDKLWRDFKSVGVIGIKVSIHENVFDEIFNLFKTKRETSMRRL